jgi:hypothetical protein
MKSFLIAFLCTSSSVMALMEPPLPTWNTDEGEEDQLAGEWLLDLETIIKEEEITPLDIDIPTSESHTDEPDEELELPEEFLSDYFELKPTGYLVDPQGLLSTRERKDLEVFLEDHSKNSSMDLYVYIFGLNQRIPSDVREEEIVEQHYSVGKPAAMIYYYLGAPQRSAMYLSPEITDTVSVTEQRSALESSVMRAFSSNIPFDQIEAFLLQVSIRIYWMERMTQGTAVETMESIPSGEGNRSFSRKKDVKKVVVLPSWLELFGAVFATCFVAILALGSAVVWWRRRAKFRFPEFDVEPRLGGSHAAGIGAVISFGSSAIPPAMQRKQVPEYMRRA